MVTRSRSLESFLDHPFCYFRYEDVLAELFLFEQIESTKGRSRVSRDTSEREASYCCLSISILQKADVFWLSKVLQIFEICYEFSIVEELLSR